MALNIPDSMVLQQKTKALGVDFYKFERLFYSYMAIYTIYIYMISIYLYIT